MYKRLHARLKRMFIDYDKIVDINAETNSYIQTLLEQTINEIKENKQEIKELTVSLNKLQLKVQSLTESNKRILLIGFYGADNLGDEIMLETLLNHLQENPQSKSSEITVMLIGNPDYTSNHLSNIKTIEYPKNLKDLSNMIEYYDTFIFGGGAIIDDNYYDKKESINVQTGSLLIELSELAQLKGKQTLYVGLSTNKTLKNKLYIDKLINIINNSTYFSLRDTYSKNTILNTNHENLDLNRINVIEDIAFSNYKIEKLKQKKNKTVGIVWVCSNKKTELIKLIDELLKKKYKINLIPFYNYLDNDYNYLKTIKQKFKNNTNIIVKPKSKTFQDIKDSFSENEFIISERYHGILLGYAFGIKTLPIMYDIHPHYNNKVKYLMELYNQKHLLKTSNINYSEFISMLEKVDNKYDSKIIESAKDDIDSIISIVYSSEDI